ncbi:MAG: glutamate racemase [Bacteroidaceae bacterium]|nr:glutamate racemase [Bacteroidaceae bacterium]
MKVLSQDPGPIGVFDSGYGGLTVLRELRKQLPQYDYLYLGDNARAPYGTRSFDVVYRYTRQAVAYLFQQGCQLVILACNTASAKALRTIQQNDLPQWDAQRRVLGVIRPTAEAVGLLTQTGHVGILATSGTILSQSYELEIQKLHPRLKVVGQACPLWATLVENFETDSPGAEYFVGKDLHSLLSQDALIDTVILGCTHYPLLLPLLEKLTPKDIRLINQGKYVSLSLQDYLQRHPEMERRCTKHGSCRYLTTESPSVFDATASHFMDAHIESRHTDLNTD